MSSKEQKFPRNDHFYASQRRRISRERPFLCQPKDGNSQEIANFMPAEGQKFREKDHFLPTEGQEFPENGQFCTSRKTKKMNPTTIFLRPAGKSRPKFLPRKAGNPKKISGKTGNGTTCPQTEPGFFHAAGQMTSRKSRIAGTFLHRTARIFYVSLPGNVRSTRRKPTVPGRKTYGLHTGNIENIKEKRGYPADIFRIRNTGKNKRTVYRKRTEKPHTEKQGKQSEGKLTENQEDKSGLKTEDLT